MKKLIIVLAIIFFGCKEESKSKKPIKEIVQELPKKKYESKKVPELIKWYKFETDILNKKTVYDKDTIYQISRTSKTKAAYLKSHKIKVKKDHEYILTMVVKKGIASDFFGMKILGLYPHRSDVVFNLNTGEIIGAYSHGNFESGRGKIKKLSDGWFLCELRTKLFVDEVNLVIGATSKNRKIESWEGVTENLDDTYVVPEKIQLREVLK